MKTIILGQYNIFRGEAGTHYVKGLAKALRAIGLAPAFLAPSCTDGAASHYEPVGAVDDIDYYEVYQRPLTGWRSALRAYRAKPDERLLWIERAPVGLINEVITYSGTCAQLLTLRRICRKRGIGLTNIVVEWYDPRHLNWRKFAASLLAAIDCELQRRAVNSRIGRLIVISSYLEDYYKQRTTAVVRIPPLIDLQDPKWQPTLDWGGRRPTMRLVYAGYAGRKDLLGRVLEALASLGRAAEGITLSVLGTTRDTVAEALGGSSAIIDALGDRVQFKGLLSHAQALHEVAKADFSVLVRPDARYAHAGFPTKLVESLACGTPPIVNLTSDIGRHVHDMCEGIVLRNDSVHAVAEGLVRANKLSPGSRAALRANARRQACQSFDYRAHTNVLAEFFGIKDFSSVSAYLKNSPLHRY